MKHLVVLAPWFGAVLTLAASAQTTAPRSPAPPPPFVPDVKIEAPPVVQQGAAPRPTPSGATAAAPQVKAAAADEAGLVAASVMRVDRSVVHSMTGPDGALWLRGANYKLRAHADGLTYIPFLSSSAPRSFEMRFALREVLVGGHALDFDAAAAPSWADARVSFDRGALDEVYVVEPGSVEQQFVLESLPARGELVVRMEVETALVGSTVEDGFDFTCDWGRVHYGRATAIDAAGRALALESSLDGNAIEIRVPAGFVAAAELPLVIDPVAIAFGVETGPTASNSPDVSHGSGGYLLATWEEIYSASDRDVYSLLVDGGGNTSYGRYIDFTSAYWTKPRSAHLSAGDRFLVVAEVSGAGGTGPWSIWGVVRDPWLSAVSAQTQISEVGAYGQQLRPDVGGDPYPSSPSYFCVVWQRQFTTSDHDIHARLVDMNGNPYGGTILVDNTGAGDWKPVISRTNDSSTWFVAWERAISASDHDIWGAGILWQGTVTQPSHAIAAVAGAQETNPAICGPIQGTLRHLVAYERDFGSDDDVMLALLDGASVLIPAFNLSVAEGSFYLRDQREPAVDCNGRHFVCSYTELLGGLNHDLYTTEIASAGNSLVVLQPHTPISVSPVGDHHPQVVCHESGDSSTATTTFWTTWLLAGSQAGGSEDVHVAGFVASSGGPVSYLCGGTYLNCPCGNGPSNGFGCSNSYNSTGAYLFATGAASTAADTLTLTFGGMPPFKTALLFQGTTLINGGAGNTFGDGLRCVDAPVYRFPVRTSDGSGWAAYGNAMGDTPISSMGGVPLLGGVYYYQVWYRDPAVYCTAAGTNFTNAAKVIWTP